MDNIVLNDLLKSVHNYYPINTTEAENVPGKTTQRNKILEAKINGVINGESSAWSKLVQRLSGHHKHISNMDFLQFPSYVLTIKTEESTLSEFVTLSSSLTISVSLLSNYFTVFCEDNYEITNIKNDWEDHPIKFRIFYTERLAESGNHSVQHLLNSIKKETKTYFPTYDFVHHAALMSNTVPGNMVLPWTPQTASHSIYTYLFDGFLSYNNLEIRK